MVDTDRPAPSIAGHLRVDFWSDDGRWYESRGLAAPIITADMSTDTVGAPRGTLQAPLPPCWVCHTKVASGLGGPRSVRAGRHLPTAKCRMEWCACPAARFGWGTLQ